MTPFEDPPVNTSDEINNATPCVLCERTGGLMQNNKNRAARVNLRRYGVKGVGCYSCYRAVLYRVRHGLDPATGCRPDTAEGLAEAESRLRAEFRRRRSRIVCAAIEAVERRKGA